MMQNTGINDSSQLWTKGAVPIKMRCDIDQAVCLWFLTVWRPRFTPRAIHVGLVVDNVALGQVFPPCPLVFPHQYHSTTAPYSLMCHLGVGKQIC
jgi:hypothetical protein